MAEKVTQGLDRRRVIKTLGLVTGVGSLAGCGQQESGNSVDGGDGGGDGGGGGGGDDGGGGGDGSAGERVPTLSMEYWADLPASAVLENIAPVVKEGLEKLGVTVKINPVGFSRQHQNTVADKRTAALPMWYHSNQPNRLDPDEMTRRFAADWAGNGGGDNPINMANCEYTHPAMKQRSAANNQKRRELVNEAHSILSDQAGPIPLFPRVLYGAVRKDAVNVDESLIGDAGITYQNYRVFANWAPAEGDSLAVGGSTVDVETLNFPVQASGTSQMLYQSLINSKLVSYGTNYELENVMAESYEVEDKARQFTVRLKDATFHNGDPVTAEDVKFTFEYLSNNAAIFTQATQVPYESIKVVDDRTVQFNLTESYPPLETRVWPKWGIFHKKTFVEGGATENPEGWQPDTVVGSGPFKIDSFAQGQQLSLAPHDGHPMFEPDHRLNWVGYQSGNTAAQALLSNEIQIQPSIAYPQANSIKERDSEGNVLVDGTPGFMPYIIYPQFTMAPTMFKPFRQAVGAVINRAEANEISLGGQSEPELFSTPLMSAHPYRPPKDHLYQFTDAPTGDVEAARQQLKDAGWSWDDDGNLHYPADADLSPPWEKGERPNPDEFPCIDADYNYQPK